MPNPGTREALGGKAGGGTDLCTQVGPKNYNFHHCPHLSRQQRQRQPPLPPVPSQPKDNGIKQTVGQRGFLDVTCSGTVSSPLISCSDLEEGDDVL